LTLTLLALSLLAATGCHYQVTDPTSGRIYYTKDIDRRSGGSVQFEDERTGTEVTLQNSEVARISEYEYKRGLSGK
jgi:hypothetical protein